MSVQQNYVSFKENHGYLESDGSHKSIIKSEMKIVRVIAPQLKVSTYTLDWLEEKIRFPPMVFTRITFY